MYANVDFRSGHVSQFQEYSRKGISFKYTDEDIKIIVASNYITGAARRPAVSYNTVMTIIVFCTCRYNCSQCTNHGCKLLRTTFQMCWLLDPSPQHCSCSFRFKWLELIVLWGSLWFIGRVIYNYYYYYTGSHYVLKIEPSQYTHYYVTDIDMNEPFVVQSICFAPRIDKPPRRTTPAPI